MFRSEGSAAKNPNVEGLASRMEAEYSFPSPASRSCASPERTSTPGAVRERKAVETPMFCVFVCAVVGVQVGMIQPEGSPPVSWTAVRAVSYEPFVEMWKLGETDLWRRREAQCGCAHLSFL